MEHYYTSNPTSESCEREIEYFIDDKKIKFISDNGVFSKAHVDFATDFMIRTIKDDLTGTLLDLGCGYGVIGITLAKLCNLKHVVMCDVNNRALDLAKRNCTKNNVEVCEVVESNCFENINEKFDNIVTNPPIRAGKEALYNMYKECKEHLNYGGGLYLVINKKHGAPSTISYLTTIFENVEVLDKKAGFNVIKCF